MRSAAQRRDGRIPNPYCAMSALLTAMIFAAGRGERMHPLSDACPKPLLNAGGKALIVWQIERLARAGFRDLVINHAWRGAQIEAALGDGARWGVRIRYSAEQPALETAGGIRQALPLLEARRGPCAPATDCATTRTASASGDGAESGPSPQWRFCAAGQRPTLAHRCAASDFRQYRRLPYAHVSYTRARRALRAWALLPNRYRRAARERRTV